ncbi:MAG: phosphoglucosamine mutase [Tepidisphaeraceae bacterium]
MDALMVGVSGMRGTIGSSLTPRVVGDMAAAFAAWIKRKRPAGDAGAPRVVIGRDSRPSGPWVRDAAVAALVASGVEVIDLDLVTTPGVEMMVTHLKADGGVIITASHNPIEWNGLKMLNSLGISAKRYKVVLDSVNGAGCVPTATMLSKLGCRLVHLGGKPDGQFSHEPEPTAKNLTQLAEEVVRQGADVGFAQDPDADRLAIVDENGRYIGEEYSLVLCAQWLMSRPGKTGAVAVVNLSSSRMLDDVARANGGRVVRTPVGEANVIAAMHRENAIVGGEGNGGVIDPRIVPGRDSLVGMAYVLQLMAATGKQISQLIAQIPRYEIVKDKLPCPRPAADRAVAALKEHFASEKVDTQDGIRIDWADGWIHARASNTEPIMRIIAEATDQKTAQARIAEVRGIVEGII